MSRLPTFVSVLGQEVQANGRHHLAGALGRCHDGLCGGCGGGVDCGGGGDGGGGGVCCYGCLCYGYC